MNRSVLGGQVIALTPKQIAALALRSFASCSHVELSRYYAATVEAKYYDAARLIARYKIGPTGHVQVLG
jgi:hypothetical protein